MWCNQSSQLAITVGWKKRRPGKLFAFFSFDFTHTQNNCFWRSIWIRKKTFFLHLYDVPLFLTNLFKIFTLNIFSNNNKRKQISQKNDSNFTAVCNNLNHHRPCNSITTDISFLVYINFNIIILSPQVNPIYPLTGYPSTVFLCSSIRIFFTSLYFVSITFRFLFLHSRASIIGSSFESECLCTKLVKSNNITFSCNYKLFPQA